MLIILIASHGRELKREHEHERKQEHERGHEREHERDHQREFPQKTPDEQLSHNAPNIHHIEMKSELRGQGESKNQGTVTEGPPNPPPKHTPVDDRLGEDVRHAVRFEGECRRPSDIFLFTPTSYGGGPGGLGAWDCSRSRRPSKGGC